MTNIRKIKYGHVTNSILEQLADFLIEIDQFGPKPRLPYLLGLLIKSVTVKNTQKVNLIQINRAIKTLEKRNLISLKHIDNRVYVILEDKGVKKLAKYSYKKILDYKLKNKKWNGYWFLVFFDIPETQKIKRDYLRKFLKEIGFYPYQQSVYIFPYECEQEINYIRKIVESGKYAKFIIAKKIEDEDIIKKHFKLK